MDKFVLEWYNLKENVGMGLINDIIYDDLKVAKKTALDIYNNLCDTNKKYTSIIINKIENEEWECVEEIGGFNE
jgi:hypothetical protein